MSSHQQIESLAFNSSFSIIAINPKSLVKTQQRYAGIMWGDEKTAIVMDQWYDTRNMKTYLINPSNTNVAPKVINDRNYQDMYSDPGSFEMVIWRIMVGVF